MSKRITIFRKNNIFKGYDCASEQYKERRAHESGWHGFICESTTSQHHFKDYQSRGIVKIQRSDADQIKVGNFILEYKIEGTWWSYNDFSTNKYTLGWKVSDNTGREEVLVFNGFDKLESVLSSFLNSLSRFDSLEEYLAMADVSETDEWKVKDTADKICALAKVIELYKKYKALNPALEVVAELAWLIEKRLKEIL